MNRRKDLPDTNRLGSKAIKLTVSKFVALAVTLISTMLLSRFRTLEEYGTYSQLLMILTIATTIVSLGFPNSINYFLSLAETNSEKDRFLSVYFTVNTSLSVVLGGVLVLLTPVFCNYFNNHSIADFIYFLAIMPWTKIICSSIENILIVYNKTNKIMLFRILNSLFLLGIILLVRFMKWSFTEYMLLYVAVEVAFSLWVYIIVFQISKIRAIFDAEMLKKILKFSIPIAIASIVGTINIELDKIVIGGFFNTEQLAIYTNASKEMPVTIISTSISAVLLPQLVKHLKNKNKEQAIELWGVSINISYAIICLISIAFIVFAPEVISILYSEKYLPGVDIFRIYCVALLTRCTYWGMILNAAGKTKFIMYSSIAAMIINIGLNYICYYLFGFSGPAIATVLSQVIMCTIQIVWTVKTINYSISKIIPWKSLSIITFSNVGLGFAFYFLKNSVDLQLLIGEELESIILGAIWTGIFIAIFSKPIKKWWMKLNA